MSRSDNRAVSTLFRAFGGAGPRVVADKRLIAEGDGLHRGEAMAFAVWIPLTVMVAVGSALAAAMGMWAGWLLAMPIAFLVLNLLPFLLPGRSAKVQWQLWCACGVVWAVFHVGNSGVVGWFASLWIGIAVWSAAGALVVGCRNLMNVHGRGGVFLRAGLWGGVHLLALCAGPRFGWGWSIFLGAAIAAAGCAMVLRPDSQALGRVYRRVEKGILITIDDGPDPHDTPRLLDLLDRHGVKAVFFMIGEKVKAHPELAREVIRRGHEIGNHTQTHPQASFWCAGPGRTQREIAECQQVIEQVTGVRPRWFRAPVGHRNLFTHPIAAAHGLRVMGWTRRGYDAVEKDAGKVLARILPDLKEGEVVLLHEATPIAEQVLSGVLEHIAHQQR